MAAPTENAAYHQYPLPFVQDLLDNSSHTRLGQGAGGQGASEDAPPMDECSRDSMSRGIALEKVDIQLQGMQLQRYGLQQTHPRPRAEGSLGVAPAHTHGPWAVGSLRWSAFDGWRTAVTRVTWRFMGQGPRSVGH